MLPAVLLVVLAVAYAMPAGGATWALASPAVLSPEQIAQRYPGLKPFPPAPPSPALKPVDTSGPLPPVVWRIPTNRRIVFVTIDDGWQKDPRLVQLITDMHVPVTMFLTDSAIRSNLAYFRQLQALGNHIQDHTLTHPAFSKLPPDRRRAEICDQAAKLQQEFGQRPYLFRPPYGNPYFPLRSPAYSDVKRDIEQASASCGIKAIVLWEETMQKQNLQYRGGEHKLKPGDIILTHFIKFGNVGETQRMINLFQQIQAQGYTVARLEDYV
jgi:peptidoglycan/xylan/chitin deacetylase (PgdA/CDA1 family)